MTKGLYLSEAIARRLLKVLQWGESLMRRNVEPVSISGSYPRDVILQKFGVLTEELTRTSEAEVRIWHQSREDGNTWTEGAEEDVETAYGRFVPSGKALPVGTFVELTRNRQTGFWLATQADDCAGEPTPPEE